MPLLAQDDCAEQVAAQVRVDAGHPWRPPFGLDRVGQPLTVLVEVTADKPLVREYSLVAYLRKREVGRYVLTEINHHRKDETSYSQRLTLDTYPDELALFAQCRFQGKPVELTREEIQRPALEADATARPETLINPVDLGMVLFPADWLLLGPDQNSIVDVAAISRGGDLEGARAIAWFESSPKERISEAFPLTSDRKAQVSLRLPGLHLSSVTCCMWQSLTLRGRNSGKRGFRPLVLRRGHGGRHLARPTPSCVSTRRFPSATSNRARFLP
ncbi:MAG: hypothetical protein DMG24_08760 [Acidobacteria bacterium]|nr:MAG: hypothetical protein DMG24_08760 [Acidobacteriota bacterium]